jgi:hypothetical protein
VKGKYEGTWLKDVLIAGPREKKLHPWQQTEADFAELVEMSTQPGETIIDPFFGSGTLGEATIKLNRDFIGIEIEPNTMKTAERRLECVAKKIVLPSHYSDINLDIQNASKKQSAGKRFSGGDKERIQTEDGVEKEAAGEKRLPDLPN